MDSESYTKFISERSTTDMYVERGSQTFESRHIDRSSMTDEPDTIELGCDAFDFEIQAEIDTVRKSKLEELESGFEDQIQNELENHEKSPFFQVPKDLDSIKFFDYNESNGKASRTKLGARINNKRNLKDTNVSIHNSNWKVSKGFSKQLNSESTPFRKKTATQKTQGSSKDSRSVGFAQSSSEFNDHIENEMRKFAKKLEGNRIDLVISEEEYGVRVIS